METKTVQKIITETKFVASDGKEFDNEWDCKYYEQKLTADADEQLLNTVKNIDATNPCDSQAGGYSACCYYLQNQKEYEAMVRYWFQDNADDGGEFYIDKPTLDHWEFPLWVYISGCGEYGYDVFRAEDYIKWTKEHIRKLENAMAQAGVGETI